MDIHPWTKYEIARARDEERLLRARAAMRSKEVREEHSSKALPSRSQPPSSWLDRILRRGSLAERKPAGVG